MRLFYIASRLTLASLCLPVSASYSNNLETALSATPTCCQPAPTSAQTTPSQRDSRGRAQESEPLEPARLVERELSGGQSHSYKITMSSGQYTQIVVEQRGIDVATALYAPDGKKVSEVDRESANEGSEMVLTIAEVSGDYRIEVHSSEKTAKRGIYRIKIEDLRTATAEDKYRVSAWTISRNAERLQNGTVEARRESIKKYQEARELFSKASDLKGEAQTLSSLSEIYWSLSDMPMVLESSQEALSISRAAGDRKSEAVALNNIGAVYGITGETQSALEKYNEALSIRRALDDRRGESQIFNDIGAVYRNMGEMQKALEMFTQAFNIRRETDDRRGVAVTLYSIGLIYQLSGEMQKAVEMFNQAAHLHQKTPSASFDTLALAVSERARARSLLELLTEARADIRQGIDSALLERERSLRQRLAARATAQVNLLNGKHTTEQAEAAAKEISSITTKYEEIEAQIRASSPRYAALTLPQPLNLTEIQQQVLDSETLLLEYSLGNDASYLFLVSQTSISSHQLPKRAEIEMAARRVYQLLTAQQPKPGESVAEHQARIDDAKKNYLLQAAALSKMLLGPVASQLGNKRLVIVADGALQYTPLAALPLPSAASEDAQPLIVEHEVVSIPSASSLAILRSEIAGRKPAEKALAVLADPVFAADDTRVRQLAGKNGVERKLKPADSAKGDIVSLQMSRSARETGVAESEAPFSRLLNTRREATAILALVPERERKQALDFQASRATAFSPDLAQYRIIHFATHGLLNTLHPALSGIVLSLVDKEGNPQDGFLRLQDIYNLKLPAELVVLSACQTGLGKEIKGEGLIGLTRGFMYAGTPRIVASLWKVDDRATSELMKRFYQEMLGPARLRPAAALRQAQLSIWKENHWRAPYYWAAFILQGEWK
jgi:CHAT domain-containing protein